MRILVIQTAFIGDVALTTPFLRALRERWPKARIDVVATPQGCELLAGLEGVQGVPLDKRRAGAVKGLRATIEKLGGRKTEFDLIFCVHRSLRSLALARKLKARRKIAFRGFWSRMFGFETVPYPAYSDDVHYSDKPLRLLGEGELKAPPVWLETAKADEDSVREKLRGLPLEKGYVVLSPFSVWGTKMWFADRFARAGAEIARRNQLPIVVVGGGAGSETVIGQTIVEKITAAGGRAVSLVGRTSLGELKAVIRGARLLVANDSAPVHVASAFNVRTVAIFGPTVRKWGFFPRSEHSIVVERADVACRPCHIHGPPKCPKGHFRCMNEIQVEDVVQAVQNLLR